MLNLLRPERRNATRYIKSLLCAAVIIFSTGGAYAQTERVIFPAREVTVKKAFDEIAHQTPCRIPADLSVLDQERSTLLSDNVLAVGDLLRQVLAGTGYSYRINDKQIFLITEQERDPDASNLSPPHGRSASGSERTITTGRRTGHWLSAGNEGEFIEIVMVNFRVGKSLLLRDFMNNRYSLDILSRTLSNPELVANMDYITITAAASPEGNTKQNQKLSYDRAMAIKSYIIWKYPHIDRNRILIHPIGEDWAGLKKMVEDDAAVPGRRNVLELLDSSVSNDTKKQRLKAIDNGRAYAYIAKKMLPYLRGGAACMIYYKNDSPAPEAATPEPEIRYIERVRVDTIFIDRERIIEAHAKTPPDRKPYYMAVKSNLLYDALLLPNLAVEFSLPQRWSVELEGHWSWWNTDWGKHYYHRVQAVGLEARKWLGNGYRTPLTGHYLGVYGIGGDYDIRMGDTGYLSAEGSWSAGISYGYSTPIGRSFNLELGIGVGYLGGEYKKYTYDGEYDRYPWQSDHNSNYIGLTKAKVSLVWLVGSGKNQNKKR